MIIVFVILVCVYIHVYLIRALEGWWRHEMGGGRNSIYSMLEGIFLGLLMASKDPCHAAIFWKIENIIKNIMNI